jgi:hypothetical protein
MLYPRSFPPIRILAYEPYWCSMTVALMRVTRWFLWESLLRIAWPLNKHAYAGHLNSFAPLRALLVLHLTAAFMKWWYLWESIDDTYESQSAMLVSVIRWYLWASFDDTYMSFGDTHESQSMILMSSVNRWYLWASIDDTSPFQNLSNFWSVASLFMY